MFYRPLCREVVAYVSALGMGLSLALLLATATSAQQPAGRWIDNFDRSVRRLNAEVERTLPGDSRLRRQADRLLERASAVIDARESPSQRDLQRVHDAAAVLKSDLLDSAARTHPERLGRLERLIGLTEAVRGHAVAARFAEASSLSEIQEQIALSAEETADVMNATLEELTEDTPRGARHSLDQVADRVRSLRDSVSALAETDDRGKTDAAMSAANEALVVRGQLLVLAVSGAELPAPTLQAARRAALHLEGELSDYSLLAAQQERAAPPTQMARLSALTDVLGSDLRALLAATPDQRRDMVQAMVADSSRVQKDIQNVTSNPEYAPRQRLDDIYGRITRIIEQTDAYSAQATDRTRSLLAIAQADAAALRELAVLAATEQLRLYDHSAQQLLPQMVNIDLGAEEQLQVKLGVHNGRLTVAGVGRGGPAAQAGIREGDVLLTGNGQQLQTDVDLARELEATTRARKSLRIDIQRGGERLVREISLGSTPRHANRSQQTDGNR